MLVAVLADHHPCFGAAYGLPFRLNVLLIGMSMCITYIWF